MKHLSLIAPILSAFREFVAPRYRPELHYMRGPGPAYARSKVMVDSAETARRPVMTTQDSTKRGASGVFRLVPSRVDFHSSQAAFADHWSELLPVQEF